MNELKAARIMVRQYFNVGSDEEADAIAAAANRGCLMPSLEEFEARLLSVRALFEHALGGR